MYAKRVPGASCSGSEKVAGASSSDKGVPEASCFGSNSAAASKPEASTTHGNPEQDAPATTSAGRNAPELEASATTKACIALDWQTLAIKRGDNLPHWSCAWAIYHVAFRLADSVPDTVRAGWLQERDCIVATASQMGRPLSDDEEKRLQYLYSEKIEKYLDTGHGACHLAKPAIAELVANALRFFDGDRYRLHAWCVMPNHVHVIVEPSNGQQLNRITHSWKSFTAKAANDQLGLSGQFWQHEPYDHIIRSAKEYLFQINYVWENPDKAKLKNWPWRWQKVAGASCSGSERVPGASSSVKVVPEASCFGLNSAAASKPEASTTHGNPEQDAPATTYNLYAYPSIGNCPL